MINIEKKKWVIPELKELEIMNGKVILKGKKYAIDQILKRNKSVFDQTLRGKNLKTHTSKKSKDVEIKESKYLYHHF